MIIFGYKPAGTRVSQSAVARHAAGQGRGRFGSGGCRLPAVLVVLCLAAALAGCGYRMIGGGNLPGNVHTIAIPLLENRTAETGLETILADALITELNRRRKDSVTDLARAQAVLNGTIEALGSETVARSGTHTALERRLFIVVSLVLTRSKDSEVLWQRSGLRAEESYSVTGDNAADDANRNQALSLVVDRLAEMVMRGLTDEF